MVNIDIVIKLIRELGFSDWPERSLDFMDRLEEMKKGFPGIRNEYLTLSKYRNIQPREIFIYDPGMFSGESDEAPVMLKALGNGQAIIEGLGCGLDPFDPDRILRRWKDIISVPFGKLLMTEWPVYKVDVKPYMNGGKGYYYFLRSYRDYRF